MTTTDTIVFPEPDEIEGFWNLDKMHAPRPITPLSFDLIVHTLSEGFTKAQAEYDCPIMVTNKEVNHYMYAASPTTTALAYPERVALAYAPPAVPSSTTRSVLSTWRGGRRSRSTARQSERSMVGTELAARMASDAWHTAPSR